MNCETTGAGPAPTPRALQVNVRRHHPLLGLLAALAAAAVLLVPALSCHEELPVYQDPSRVLALEITSIEQLNDHIAPPGRQAVRIILSGENIYDEVVFDSVHLDGNI